MAAAALFREREVRLTTLPGAAVMNALLWRHRRMPLRSRSLYEYVTPGLALWVEFTDISMRRLPRTATNVSLAFWVISSLGLSFGKGLLRYGNVGCLSGEGSFFSGLWSQCRARWSASLFIHRTMVPISPILNQWSVEQWPVWINYYEKGPSVECMFDAVNLPESTHAWRNSFEVVRLLYDKPGFKNTPRSFAVLLGSKSFPNKDRVISWSLGSR